MAERRRIIVTGAAGFIGGNLCRRLGREGFKVIGLDNLSAGVLENLPDGVEFHPADIRDENIFPLFKGVDTVFHLAAKNCLADCLQDPRQTSDVNITGTINVLEAARRSGARKFIFADSSAVYEGINIFPTPVDQVKPLGPYAVSKHAAGRYVHIYQKHFGLNTTNLRYFNVYGRAQDYRRTIPPVMSGFILRILRGERPLIYGSGKKRRDFIHIDDVNNFHLLVMDDPRTEGKVFNLGTGINYSVIEVLDRVNAALGTKVDPIHAEALPGEAAATQADISQSIKLGWRPRIEIDEGIADAVAYLRQELRKEEPLSSRERL